MFILKKDSCTLVEESDFFFCNPTKSDLVGLQKKVTFLLLSVDNYEASTLFLKEVYSKKKEFAPLWN